MPSDNTYYCASLQDMCERGSTRVNIKRHRCSFGYYVETCKISISIPVECTATHTGKSFIACTQIDTMNLVTLCIYIDVRITLISNNISKNCKVFQMYRIYTIVGMCYCECGTVENWSVRAPSGITRILVLCSRQRSLTRGVT